MGGIRRFSLLLLLLLVGTGSALAANGEYIVVVGGPSMYQWEKYKLYPHDHWWANFVRAARLRTEQLRTQLGPDQQITWLVYKQGYLDRAKQEHQDLVALIDSVREKLNLNLVWFNAGPDVIEYLNKGQPRNQVKITGFEYFGHSNRACFMIDYSNEIGSGSKVWLHEDELKAKPQRIWLCGFGPESADLARQWNAEWGVEVEPLRSRFGAPAGNDAGLRGYLESVAG